MTFHSAQVSIVRYLKSTDFSKGYILAFAVVVPILLGNYFNYSSVGIGVAVGVFLIAPTDLPGNLRHRFYGMLSAALIAVIVTLIVGYGNAYIWWRLPLVFFMVFFTSYISVYGFRASMVSFAGLMATVLSLANLGIESIWLHAIYIGIGGVWYILITSVFLFMRPQKHLETLLGETSKMTADFLALRAKMLTDKANRTKFQEEQFNLQTNINDYHENIREALLSSRKQSGLSNFARRKLLIFIDLVDVLELGLAHPVNFKKVDELALDHPQIIKKFTELVLEMSKQLQHISDVFIDGIQLKSNQNIPHIIEEIEEMISDFRWEDSYPDSRPSIILLRTVLDFEKKQSQKIVSIERVLGDMAEMNKFLVKDREIRKFLTPTDYSFKILQQNFSLTSPIFRHSARLAVLVLLGILIGQFFHLQNAYWIILTIVVIMRPSYGLTKDRSKKRIIGTLIGGAVAVVVVLVVQNPVVYAVLGIICLILAFSMIQKNYVGAAAFITLNVVFIYTLLQPNALNVIQYRILDTVIGSGLAMLGNFLLWPSWEHLEIHKNLIAALKANIEYLKEIDKFYHQKGKLPNSYKLKRKEAFLEMGNLSAAFQRMSQEPKSKQKDYSELYEFTVLNYTFLSSLASLGTFIRNHKTTEASNYFDTYISHIIHNLQQTIAQLDEKELHKNQTENSIEKADISLEEAAQKLERKRNKEIEAGKENISSGLRVHMQEIQLISEQLKWLYEVSLNLKNVYLSNKKTI